ncbi:hypothetical protein Harman_28620 [Haloarcula mannanilytica]|uniref:DUF7978 domain-containing protein n=1 Tax=Haloarcula mannanilytica TaxID=2509225 RepID=A0A4C2EMR7_9EURY|nr:hypothetical protein [Haloarcula mannanilytica]GCF14927.1 hypothetical protein Harman_28620 [Haloarcula mannanilytica]
MSDTARRSYGVGALAGTAAFVLTYVFVYALSIPTVQDALLTNIAESFGDDRAAWKIVGWVFFNAQFVTTTITVNIPFLGGTSAVNFIAENESLSPILYLLPPAVLTAAGMATARLDGAADIGRAVRVGPAVVLGYLPLAVLGSVLFTVSAGESGQGAPTLLTAIVLAGIVYPVVFGTVGAALATALGEL